MVAADAHAEEHLRPVDVGEAGVVRDRPAALEQLERRLDLAALHPCPGLRRERPVLELRGAGGQDGRARVLELLDRLRELLGACQRLRAGEHRFDAAALVGGDALLQEAGVDAELDGQPLDRVARGAGLAALDLADVLLREALPGEVGLGQARGDTELPQPLAQACAVRDGGGSGLGG